jgi:putative ABC transport system substrate-binding protein
LPSIFEWPESAEDGGLIGYGPPILSVYRRLAVLVYKVLRGARPADLPIEQPTKFELTVNLQTAKAISLAIPPSLLLRADRVIE